MININPDKKVSYIVVGIINKEIFIPSERTFWIRFWESRCTRARERTRKISRSDDALSVLYTYNLVSDAWFIIFVKEGSIAGLFFVVF